MTNRDNIMDKYWLEFLRSSTYKNRYNNDLPEALFWEWFYRCKLNTPTEQTNSLEDYLK
jgi:hypothetical protein